LCENYEIFELNFIFMIISLLLQSYVFYLFIFAIIVF